MPADPDLPPAPCGVRALWPPPGAIVTRVEVRERASGTTEPVCEVVVGETPSRMDLRALWWLLDEFPRGPCPRGETAYEGHIVLEIARTTMPRGRVGHAYALNGRALGDPGADGPRGILWRWVERRLHAP